MGVFVHSFIISYVYRGVAALKREKWERKAWDLGYVHQWGYIGPQNITEPSWPSPSFCTNYFPAGIILKLLSQ